MGRYRFEGHANVGAALRRALDTIGWVLTDTSSDADAVFTYCTVQSLLEDAYFAEEGFIKHTKPGTLYVDLSPSTPSFASEFSAIALVNGMRPVEAPLVVVDTTLSDAFGDPANLFCFAAGEKADVEAARPLLSALCGSVDIKGSCGSAQLARAAHTLQMAAQILALVESHALYRATQQATPSVDRPQGCVEAATPYAQKILDAIEDQRFSGTFTLEMFMAELVAAMQAADDVDLIIPQAESIMQLLEVLAVVGGVDLSPAALTLIYRDEEEGAALGLDWSRMNNYCASGAQSGAHDLFDDEDADFDDDFDGCNYDYGDSDFPGGYGGYSAN